MERFGFIIHPIDVKRDVLRKYPFFRPVPTPIIEALAVRFPPVACSHITGVRSATGVEAEGWFVACPLTPTQMLAMPYERVWPKILAAVEKAEQLGARIVGLGAFTSVAGDGGITVGRHTSVPVTTGNSFTVATALRGTRRAAEVMEIDITKSKVAVVGATGSIGSICAQLMARQAAEVVLVGRSAEKLEAARDACMQERAVVRTDTDLHRAIYDADIIVTVTSSVSTVIDAHDLKPGAIICDVARPRDVSKRVVELRNDVFVIEGGVVAVPGAELDFHFNFGFPERTAYACMAETMILALEGRYESYTMGHHITLHQVEEIDALAAKHGFTLAGFRSFERAVSDEEIARVQENARRARLGKSTATHFVMDSPDESKVER